MIAQQDYIKILRQSKISERNLRRTTTVPVGNDMHGFADSTGLEFFAVLGRESPLALCSTVYFALCKAESKVCPN